MQGHCWRSKEKLISDIHIILLWTPTNGHTSFGQPAKTYIHELSVDTEYHLEDLQRTMAYRNGWQERIKGTHTIKFKDRHGGHFNFNLFKQNLSTTFEYICQFLEITNTPDRYDANLDNTDVVNAIDFAFWCTAWT